MTRETDDKEPLGGCDRLDAFTLPLPVVLLSHYGKLRERSAPTVWVDNRWWHGDEMRR